MERECNASKDVRAKEKEKKKKKRWRKKASHMQHVFSVTARSEYQILSSQRGVGRLEHIRRHAAHVTHV